MTPEERQQVIQALEGAAVAKLADGTYLDKDCKITTALAIMRRKREPVAYLRVSNISGLTSGVFLASQDFELKSERAEPLYKD